VLRERSVTLIGPEPPSPVSPVSVEALRREVLETMHDWRQEFLAHPNNLNNPLLSAVRGLELLPDAAHAADRESGIEACRRSVGDGSLGSLLASTHATRLGRWPGDPFLKVRQGAASSDLTSTWGFMEDAVTLARQWADSNLLT
jgi:hypothetical protein